MTDIRTNILLVIIETFINSIYETNPMFFESLKKSVSGTYGYSQLNQIMNEEIAKFSRDSLGKLDKDYSNPNLKESLWYTLKVLFKIYDKIQNCDKVYNYEILSDELEVCAIEANIPTWLYSQINDYLPQILVENLNDYKLFDNNRIEENGIVDKRYLKSQKPYTIYIGSNIPINCSDTEIIKYIKRSENDEFDIYIDKTDEPKIIVGNNSNLFQAKANGLTFNIIIYYLKNIGKNVTYKDIYFNAIKEYEKRKPSDRSKKVAECINYINNRILTEESIVKRSPETWFKKVPNQGIVNISAYLNTCLLEKRSKNKH